MDGPCTMASRNCLQSGDGASTGGRHLDARGWTRAVHGHTGVDMMKDRTWLWIIPTILLGFPFIDKYIPWVFAYWGNLFG